MKTGRDDRKRNILLILTDQQRWDTLGCYGAPMCRTPHADALAGRGVCFDMAYTSAVACSPSRASLFTGVYPHRHGVTANEKILNPELPTLATELGRAGYRLGYTGKWHVDHAKQPTEHGFAGRDFPGYGYPLVDGTIDDVEYHRRAVANGMYEPTHHYAEYLRAHGFETPELLHAWYGKSTLRDANEHEIYGLQSGGIDQTFEAMVAEDTIRALRDSVARGKEDGRPFFIWTNFWGPHTPCLVPEPYYSMYDPASIPPDPSFDETWERKPTRHRMWEEMWGLSSDGWPGWREIVARYWGYVTMLDDLTGRILSELRALGLEDSTMVVFSTDHGDTMGAHRMIEKGPFGYEEAYRLPLIVAHPDCLRPGSRNADPVYLQDMFATFLDVAGAEIPAGCDHVSIRPQVLGEEVPVGRASLLAHGGHCVPETMRVLRTPTHKLVLTPSAEGWVFDRVNAPWEVLEIYDMERDPHELENLVGLPDSRRIEDPLLQVLKAEMARTADPLLEYVEKLFAPDR